jgi:hypothetical protein
MDVRATRKVRRAVVRFEASGNCATEFTSQNGMVESSGYGDCRLNRWGREASASSGRRGNGGGSGANHIDGDHSPTSLIPADAFWKIVDSD